MPPLAALHCPRSVAGLTACPFLPAPLIEGLGNDGFQSRVERAGVGGWIVYFARDDT